MSSVLLEQSRTAGSALGALSTDASLFAALTDTELSELAAATSPLRRLVATRDALIAGEVARRSAAAGGLAQRLGYRTPEEMVRVETGVSLPEARRAVRVGSLVLDAVSPAPVEPWLRAVGTAVAAGSLSTAAADAIRNGLGSTSAGVSAGALAGAAARLLELGLDPDRLFRRARELRDQLDEAGIQDREQELFEKRSLTFTRLPDGMSLLRWRMDGETAALVNDLYDRATSPRRGGPRFVNPADGVISDAIADDARSTEQIASDVFLHLLQHGSAADPSELLGSGGAVLTIVTPASVLATGTGHGIIEGQTEPVSAETIARLACEATTVELTTDALGNPLDVGRELRLFNRKQRRALAYRDGGCLWPDCHRPPSYTEAHHLHSWQSGGTTNLDNGVLLCRHHHLLLHNEHWEIIREEHHYWLRPPPELHARVGVRKLKTKNRLLRQTG